MGLQLSHFRLPYHPISTTQFTADFTAVIDAALQRAPDTGEILEPLYVDGDAPIHGKAGENAQRVTCCANASVVNLLCTIISRYQPHRELLAGNDEAEYQILEGWLSQDTGRDGEAITLTGGVGHDGSKFHR